MKKRQPADESRPGGKLQRVLQQAAIVEKIAVADLNALRRSRGARCELEICEVSSLQIGEAKRAIRFVDEILNCATANASRRTLREHRLQRRQKAVERQSNSRPRRGSDREKGIDATPASRWHRWNCGDAGQKTSKKGNDELEPMWKNQQDPVSCVCHELQPAGDPCCLLHKFGGPDR